MGQELAFRKQDGALTPITAEAEDWLRRRKLGDAVILAPVQVQNAERRALYFVLCEIVAQNHEELKAKDGVDEALRLLCGHFNVLAFTLPSGERVFRQTPKTLAWAKMDDDEFEAFFERALEVIHSHLLPGVDVDALRKEAYLRAGGSQKKSSRRNAKSRDGG